MQIEMRVLAILLQICWQVDVPGSLAVTVNSICPSMQVSGNCHAATHRLSYCFIFIMGSGATFLNAMITGSINLL